MSDPKTLVEELRYGAEYGCDADLIERASDAIEELVADLGDADAMTEMWMRKYEALQAQLPKRGEWIPIQIGKWRGHKCSCCGIAREVPCSSSDGIPQWKWCPECGAKMEV